MAGTGALPKAPTTRLMRGSWVSGTAAASGTTFLFAASYGASGTIDF